MSKFSLIESPTSTEHGLVGDIVSTHRTITGMARAYERRQAPARRASPGSYLDIQPAYWIAGGWRSIIRDLDHSLAWDRALNKDG